MESMVHLSVQLLIIIRSTEELRVFGHNVFTRNLQRSHLDDKCSLSATGRLQIAVSAFLLYKRVGDLLHAVRWANEYYWCSSTHDQTKVARVLCDFVRVIWICDKQTRKKKDKTLTSIWDINAWQPKQCARLKPLLKLGGKEIFKPFSRKWFLYLGI